jgi:hypothetical protein
LLNVEYSNANFNIRCNVIGKRGNTRWRDERAEKCPGRTTPNELLTLLRAIDFDV